MSLESGGELLQVLGFVTARDPLRQSDSPGNDLAMGHEEAPKAEEVPQWAFDPGQQRRMVGGQLSLCEHPLRAWHLFLSQTRTAYPKAHR
jgi:hypothetical protein